MTRRDKFAAAALQGLLANPSTDIMQLVINQDFTYTRDRTLVHATPQFMYADLADKIAEEMENNAAQYLRDNTDD